MHGMDVEKKQSPPLLDSAAWVRVVEEGRLAGCRMEDIVAAAQEMGPHGDKKTLEALMIQISNEIIRILRWAIGKNYPNEGKDMIERVHGQLIEAVLQPDSADGKGLRVAFRQRVEYRAADAIRAGMKDIYRYPYAEDVGAVPATNVEPWPIIEQNAHVENLLRRIQDPRKCLAFRLYMEGVPKESKKVESIASALGVSARTVGVWIAEIQTQLKSILGEKR